jgi:hypothetical protein
LSDDVSLHLQAQDVVLLLLSRITPALLPWSLAFEAVFAMISLEFELVQYIFITGGAELEEG